MGGLVARTFVKKHKARWEVMRRKDPGLSSGGRLVQLGTPNFGSFAIPQVFTGVEGLVRKIALLDVRHNTQELLRTFNSFVGSYQMLPSPFRMKGVEPLYAAGTYGGFNVRQTHLDRARRHHEFLDDTSDVERDRFFYVAGFDQPTYADIKPDGWRRLDSEKSYAVTPHGDGRVPHRLGLFLKDPADYDPEEPDTLVTTYYVREDHGNLSASQQVLRALDSLLASGATGDLHTSLKEARAESSRARSLSPGPQAARESDAAEGRRLEEQLEACREQDEVTLRNSMRRMTTSRAMSRPAGTDDEAGGTRGPADGEESEAIAPSPEERKVEETITRGFLAFRGDEAAADDDYFESDPLIEHAQIEIGLAYGQIESIDYDAVRSARRREGDGNRPVDAVAVGHYIGVHPSAAELGLDRSISAALLAETRNDPGAKIPAVDKADLLLTQYMERGVIHGKLGQPFILPDPRAPRAAGRVERVIAVAGMGEPGRFGAPE
jgi:hypothetical protein